MFKLVFKKPEDSEIKFPTSSGSSKKQESSRKTSISALLTMPKPLTVWMTTNCGRFWKEAGVPDHLTCLLRNLYAGQEATVWTGHATTYWFQIGKRVHQGCILSLCLFTLYAEYIMGNAGLDEAQAGINWSIDCIRMQRLVSRLIQKPNKNSTSLEDQTYWWRGVSIRLWKRFCKILEQLRLYQVKI